MRYRARFVLPLLLLPWLLLRTATAQEPAARQLTLEDAVRLAIKHNADLENARLEVKRSDARVLEAWGTAMPAVDLTGHYIHMIDKPVTFFPDYFLYSFLKGIDSTIAKPTGQLIPISFAPGFSADASLNVRQILFNGAVFVGVGAAHVYSLLARDIYQSKQLETVNKVRKAYYGALMAREAMDLTRSSLRNAEANLKNVRLMRKQGIISEYDELRAQVGVENLEPVVLQMENTYGLALDALRNTIGLPQEESIQLAGSWTFEPVDDSLLTHAETLLRERNPNLSIADRQIDLNGAVVNAERSGYLPTIAAFGSYSYTAAKNNFNFSTNDFYKSTQVGLSLSFSLFQGLQTFARVEQARLEQRKSEEQKANLDRSLRLGLHSVINNLRQAKKRVEAQQKTVESAERGYQIVTTRFLSNAATQLEVNDAQLALNQAKVNRIQAIYDYLVAVADLDQLIARMPSYVADTIE